MNTLTLDNNIIVNYNQQNYGSDNSPTIFFIHGLMSDMHGIKCQKIADFCEKRKFNFVAFDNAGHGESSGEFTEMNMSMWVETASLLISNLNLKNIILIGSSKGAWVSLLLSQIKTQDLMGQILLAPAPDFTEYIYNSLTDIDRKKIDDNNIVRILRNDDFDGIPISKQLITDGKQHLLLNKDEVIFNKPVVIIQGMKDELVHYDRALKLNSIIKTPSTTLKLLKDSGHRLSSDIDILNIENSILEIISINN